jgi:hypothetical protein
MLGILSDGGRLKSFTATFSIELNSDENKAQDDDELGLLGRSPSRHHDHANCSRGDERKRGRGGHQRPTGERGRQFGHLVEAAERT